ncbi:helix-turn-helix domain-containing protein [Pseudomonadota bacterium]
MIFGHIQQEIDEYTQAVFDEVRFAEAKKLLQKPGTQIEDVAISVGFADQSNFTRMFRRLGGLSPREFRKAALD